MAETISWVATAATIIAALMTAANLGSRVTGYGFAVFTFGAVCWLVTAAMTDQPALLWTNAVLLVVDVFGVWRWLGRQARVDEGARTASERSERTPGEALFPVSLLGRAPVLCGSREVGRCVEAMAGCRSGRLDYVVVSEGGVAGVGERLRRLAWSEAHVEGESVQTHFAADRVRALDELQRDEWPGR
jgi:membrane protein implicated in regulation of membrane protease activity